MEPGVFEQVVFAWDGSADIAPVAGSDFHGTGADFNGTVDRIRGRARMEDPTGLGRGARRPEKSICILRDSGHVMIVRRTRGSGNNRDDICHALIGDKSLTAFQALVIEREFGWIGDRSQLTQTRLDVVDLRGRIPPPTPADPAAGPPAALEQQLIVRILAYWLRDCKTNMVVVHPAIESVAIPVIGVVVDILDTIAADMPRSEADYTFSSWETRYTGRGVGLPQIIFAPEANDDTGSLTGRSRVEISGSGTVPPQQSATAEELLQMWIDGTIAGVLDRDDLTAARTVRERVQVLCDPRPVEPVRSTVRTREPVVDHPDRDPRHASGSPVPKPPPEDLGRVAPPTVPVPAQLAPPVTVPTPPEPSPPLAPDGDALHERAKTAVLSGLREPDEAARGQSLSMLSALASQREDARWHIARGTRQGLADALRNDGGRHRLHLTSEILAGLLRIGFPDGFSAEVLNDQSARELIRDARTPGLVDGLIQVARAPQRTDSGTFTGLLGQRLIRDHERRARRRGLRRLATRPWLIFMTGVVAASAWNTLLILVIAALR